MRAATVILIAAALAACAPVRAPAPATPAECVALFQRFDDLERLYGTASRRADRRSAAPELLLLGRRIQQAGCFTATKELAVGDGAGARIGPQGAAIVPVSLHAGVVTNMQDDARALAFFEARGVRARSIGSASLGRRIYLGPVGTDGALAAAADLARQAGFASPYPADF